jgi:hypothetical protein
VNFFKSRYVRELEAQIEELRESLRDASIDERARALIANDLHKAEISRHTEMLDYERTLHANAIARADQDAVNAELLFRSQIADLKKAHAEELKRVIEESQRLRNENERFRLLYSPVDRKAQTQQDEDESSTRPTSEKTTFGEMVAAGTPWQRILAREIAAQFAEPIARAVPDNPPNEVTSDADGQSR